jgi:hypothetical protein
LPFDSSEKMSCISCLFSLALMFCLLSLGCRFSRSTLEVPNRSYSLARSDGSRPISMQGPDWHLNNAEAG